MSLDRVRIIADGFPGGKGYTNLYFGTATAASLTAIRALFSAFVSYVPINVTWTFPSSGDTISEEDGHLMGGWSAAAPAPLSATGGLVYAAPCGFGLEWKIAGVVDGRRPIAKTFFVPSSQAAFTNSGGIAPALTTAAATAIGTFLTAAPGFSLWHRPVYDRTVKPPTLTRPGGAFPIVSGACSSKVFVMKSRRD